MVNAECNNDLQTFFGRDIQTTFAEVETPEEVNLPSFE